MKLYDIPQEIERFEQMLEEGGGELTPELEQHWSDFVKQGKEKLEGAGLVLLRMKGNGETLKSEIDRLCTRKLRNETNSKRLRELTLFALGPFGGKLKTALVSMWTGRSGRTVSLEVKAGVDLVQVKQTHPDLVRVKYEADIATAKDRYVKVWEAWSAEREAAILEAGGECSDEMEQGFQQRWKAMLEEAGIPDIFNVHVSAGTEYLVVK